MFLEKEKRASLMGKKRKKIMNNFNSHSKGITKM